MPLPPDKFTSFNDAGKSTADILAALAALYAQGYTGPIASKYNSDGSTTYFVGGY